MEGDAFSRFFLPFEAYPSQLEFMKDAYRCFEESRFGLFESPTGSGKTIAILSSTLTWLKENRLNDAISRLRVGQAPDNAPPWVTVNTERQIKAMAESLVASEYEAIVNKRKAIQKDVIITESGIRLRPGAKRQRRELQGNSIPPDDDGKPSRDKVQIIICSRTFSQLEQYVKEFRRLDELTDNVRLGIALGRTHACINSSVRSKCRSNEEFNNECRSSACDFKGNVDQLAEFAACFPMDIEDLKDAGKGICGCPYYASLKNIPDSDVVLAPYVSVFQESIRKALGIRTEGSIIIIDEAHNLADAITEAHSSVISAKEMLALTRQCRSFIQKFFKSVDDPNKEGIERIIRAAEALSDCCKLEGETRSSDGTIVLSISAFIVRMELESTMFHEILNFLACGDFCKRLRGWAERLWNGENKGNENKPLDHHKTYFTAIYSFMNFVSALLSATEYDWMLISMLPDDANMELFSISADERFQCLVQRSRSTLLMSGTLSPIEGFMRLLPSGVEPVVHMSKPIFPPNRFFAAIVASDEQGDPLVYDSLHRDGEREMNILCTIIGEASSSVPNGIVCFFSGYEYLGKFKRYFEESSEKSKVLRNKATFFESKGGGNVFSKFSKEALSGGAILFAVYGGSQSEGIDFRDGLARLVLLIGLPYPPDGVKLQLHRDYFKDKSLNSSVSPQQRGLYATLSSDIKSILCFKTVNQSIGRAMRHKNDYAAIVLLDHRYEEPYYRKMLPEYVLRSLHSSKLKRAGSLKIRDLMSSLIDFYQENHLM